MLLYKLLVAAHPDFVPVFSLYVYFYVSWTFHQFWILFIWFIPSKLGMCTLYTAKNQFWYQTKNYSVLSFIALLSWERYSLNHIHLVKNSPHYFHHQLIFWPQKVIKWAFDEVLNSSFFIIPDHYTMNVYITTMASHKSRMTRLVSLLMSKVFIPLWPASGPG